MPNLGLPGGTTLLDLPSSLVVRISQDLDCQDLPSLICTCQDLAALGPEIFQACTRVDMRWFPWVGPRLCQQLLSRLQPGALRVLWFSFSVFKYDTLWCPEALKHCQPHARYSPEIEARILARFPSQVLRGCASDRLLVNILYGRSIPRPIDVLVHALLLEDFLKSQPKLTDLCVDCEASVRFWPFDEALMEMVLVGQNAPLLESYHVNARFVRSEDDPGGAAEVLQLLEGCPRLRTLSASIPLNSASLAGYEGLQQPLALETAHFTVGQLDDGGVATCHRLQRLAARFPRLRSATLTYGRGECLPALGHFLRELPSLQAISMSPEQTMHYNVEDSEAVQEDSILVGFFNTLPSHLSSLTLNHLHERDFHALFAPGNIQSYPSLPKSLRSLEMRFISWPRESLSIQERNMVKNLLLKSPELEAYEVLVSTGLRATGADVILRHCKSQ